MFQPQSRVEECKDVPKKGQLFSTLHLLRERTLGPELTRKERRLVAHPPLREAPSSFFRIFGIAAIRLHRVSASYDIVRRGLGPLLGPLLCLRVKRPLQHPCSELHRMFQRRTLKATGAKHGAGSWRWLHSPASQLPGSDLHRHQPPKSQVYCQNTTRSHVKHWGRCPELEAIWKIRQATATSLCENIWSLCAGHANGRRPAPSSAN